MMIIFPSRHPQRFMWQVLMFPSVMAALEHYIIFMSRIEYSHTLLPVCSLMTALTSSLEIMISPQLSPHNNVLLIRSSGEDNVKLHLTF